MSNKYANIISYRPNIRYRKKETEHYNPNVKYEEYTVVNDFVSNTPSNNLIKANNIIVTAKEILSELEKMYFELKYENETFIQYTSYIKDGLTNKANEIYEKAKNDINSNIVFEVYKQVYDEYQGVIKLDNIYSTINYGKNTDIEEAYTIDEQKAEDIMIFEAKEFEKINYASMFFESKLNKIVESKLELSSIFINSIGTIPTVDYQSEVNDKESVDKGIKYLFDSVTSNCNNEFNKFSNVSDNDNFCKVYKLICKKLIEYYDLLSMSESITNNINDTIISDIDNSIKKIKEEIDYYINQLYINVINSSFEFDKYLESLTKKSDIKNFYQT